MVYTWRTLLVMALSIVYAIAGAMIFGIAVTATSMGILYVASAAYRRIRKPATQTSVVILIGVTTVAFYIGTFVGFRVFRTYEFSLAPLDDPQHNLVVFSVDPTAQQFVRSAYFPLIKWFPGHCDYPTGQEMNLLNRNPFTGERLTLYW